MSEFSEERLEAIEELPLEQRADAYVQIHDELLTELQGGDSAQ